MVFSFKRNKAQKQQELLDAQEAFNLWDILRSKYIAVEQLKTWKNFIHDKDLTIMLNSHLKSLQENIKILENKAKTYSLKGPDHNKSFIKTPVNPSIVTDEYIANNYFLYLQEHIGNLAQTFRSSMTNDSFRQVIHKIALKTIAEEDALVKYMKIKGWLETPPMYPNLPAAVEEKITTCEAYHLWDHLAFRYDNIHQTHLFANYAYDGDLKLMLEMGLKTLEKQCNLLEKELRQFGINLPKRPSEILPLPDNTEIFADDHMFRTLLIGLQGASIVHVAALKQATFNDRIRGIFKQLLFEEMEYIDKLIAFSKVKGWLNAPPQYRV